jgi:hypothetical protein
MASLASSLAGRKSTSMFVWFVVFNEDSAASKPATIASLINFEVFVMFNNCPPTFVMLDLLVPGS